MTANSPKPIVSTLIQYGSLKNVNSQPTIKALNITGNNIAMIKCLENIIAKHVKAVAIVPNKISKEAVGEKQLAIKHPNVKPILNLLLKKQSKTNISENLNWIGPYDKGDIKTVNATYVAAIRALKLIS